MFFTIVSKMGMVWTVIPSFSGIFSNAVAYAIIFNGGKWIASGGSNAANTKLATSTDTISWSSNSALSATGINGVSDLCANGSNVVAVGSNGTIAYSIDNASTWTLVTIAGAKTITNIVWTGSYYLALENNSGISKIYTSTDLTNWTRQLGYNAVTIIIGRYVLFNGDKVLVCAQTHLIVESLDGVTWTVNATAQQILGVQNRNLVIAFNGSTYLAAQSTGGACLTSTDVTNWSSQPAFSVAYGTGSVNDAIWDGSKFIVIGNKAASSVDGITWIAQQNYNTIGLTGRSIAVNGLDIAVVGSGAGSIGICATAQN
jgi:hypothetical protein